jgi:hypothetical protein
MLWRASKIYTHRQYQQSNDSDDLDANEDKLCLAVDLYSKYIQEEYKYNEHQNTSSWLKCS